MECLKSTFNDQTGTFLQNQLPYNDRQSDDILEYNNMATQPLGQGSVIIG